MQGNMQYATRQNADETFAAIGRIAHRAERRDPRDPKCHRQPHRGEPRDLRIAGDRRQPADIDT